jgi:hypothetical protein
MTSWTLRACYALVLLVSLGSPGWADTTAAHFSVKADTAIAVFEATSPTDACLVFTVMVIASDQMQKLSPDGGPIASVETMLIVAIEDVCQGITLLSGEGETAQPSFRMAGDLRSATLTATVPVLDNITGQLINYSVNLTWTATGQPVFEQSKETFRDRDLGIFAVVQFRGRTVDAEATGTVAGLGENFTPAPSTSAQLLTQNDGFVTIEMTH